jgi:hypothetical protein
VAASSRRTEEKVASLRGSGRHWRRASRARALSLRLNLLAVRWSNRKGFSDVPKEAANDMLEKTDGLLLHKLVDHVAEHCAHCIEALVCLTDVCKTNVVEQDLLHNEDSNSLTKLRTCLHNTKAKRDDLGCEEEVYHLGGVVLDERTDDTQGGQAEVLEGTRLGRGVEEGV